MLAFRLNFGAYGLKYGHTKPTSYAVLGSQLKCDNAEAPFCLATDNRRNSPRHPYFAART